MTTTPNHIAKPQVGNTALALVMAARASGGTVESFCGVQFKPGDKPTGSTEVDTCPDCAKAYQARHHVR